MTIAWNRPEKKNALTQLMYEAAAEALEKAASDSAIRVVVITGTPDYFTSGNDLNDFLANPATGADSPVARFLANIALFEKPLVAAVNGAAIGVGTTMLLHCDLVVAADSTTFSMPFVKLGACPEAASSYLLPRVAGYQRAAELLLLGDNFDVQMARECGIVNRVASAQQYQSVAQALAKQLAALPPASLRTSKAFLKSDHRSAIEARMKEEGETFGHLITQPEAVEAMTAFIERRAADFSKF